MLKKIYSGYVIPAQAGIQTYSILRILSRSILLAVSSISSAKSGAIWSLTFIFK
jgi:hypothetical protein